MARGHLVVAVANPLFEGTELDETVAHHIRVGGKALLHTLNGIAYHHVPVFLLKVGHLERQAIVACCGTGELDVLLGCATAVLAFHPYLNVMEVGLVALLAKLVNHHSAVHAARDKNCYIHCLKHHVFCPSKVRTVRLTESPA